MATTIDIEKTRGDTRRHTFIIKDDGGVIVDISAWTLFVMAVTSDKDPTDGTTLQEAMTGVFITDGTDGRIGFTPAGTLPVAKHYYDAQAIDANSEKVTFAEGEYKVTQDRGKS